MSALDKLAERLQEVATYQNRDDGTDWAYADLEDMADAALTACAAEVERLEKRDEQTWQLNLSNTRRAEQAEAELRFERGLKDDAIRRFKAVEAELAALKARRCGTCGNYHPWSAHSNAQCREDVEVGYRVDGKNPPPDFSCSRWQPREEAHRA